MIKHKILKQAVLNNIMTNGNKQTSEKIFVKTVKVIQKNKRKKNFETIEGKFLHTMTFRNPTYFSTATYYDFYQKKKY